MISTLAKAYVGAKLGKTAMRKKDETIGHAMGWVSLGIGLTELLAPRQLERIMGIGDGKYSGVIRTLGVRELLHGADILSHKDPTQGIWARVVGDMLDGVLLAAAARKSKNMGGFLAIAAAVLPVVIADMVLAPKLSAEH